MPVYRPWRYGNRQDVRERDVRDFRQNSAYYEEQQQSTPKRDTSLPIDRVREGKSKSSNAFKKLGGGIKDIAEDAGDLGKKAGGLALKALDAPTEYVGKPAFGVVSGLTRSEVYTDPETGQRYRKTASFKDVGEALVAAAKNPLDAYREGRQATDEYLADPDKSAIQRGVTRAAIDPLSYVGPGLAAKGVKAAGLSGKAGRVTYELLESGGPGVVLGGNVAGEVEATHGDEIPGWNKLPKTGRVIAASVAGGVAGGVAARQIAKGRVGLSIENKPEGKRSVVRSSIDQAKTYEFRYRLVDLDDVVVSHDPWSMAENPAYAKEIQPRNRGSAAGKLQVEGMAQNLDPQKLLAETGDLQNGIPIIGADGIVESGNGRTMATIRAAQDHPGVYAEYVRQLSEKLPEFGIPREEIANMTRPYLVRERLTDVDRAAFGAEANGASTLRMGTVETAMADAKMIPDELIHNMEIPEGATIDQVIGSPRSAEFVRSFMNRLPENERAALMDANGNLNAAGMQRLKAAFFAKTYGGEAGQRLLADFFESPDPSVRNVRQGMEASLPAVAQMEAGVRAGRIAAEFSVADDIASAADAFARIKSGTLKFKTIGDYLAQSSMFGDEMQLNPRAREFLRFMDEHNRAPKQIREALRSYSESVMALPPPNQTGLFGGTGPGRTFAEVWEKTTGSIMPEEVVNQTGLPMGQGAVNVGGEPIPSPLPDSAQPSRTSADQSLPDSTEPPAPRTADTNVVNESNPSAPRPTDTSSELPREASPGSEGRSIPESVPPAEGRGRPTGGIGGRIEEPPGLPPEGPPREPGGPGTPTGKAQAPFGQEGPGVDLLDGKTRDELMARETKYLQSRKGKLDQNTRKMLSRLGFDSLAPNLIRDPRFTPVWEEMNRVTNMRQSAKALVEAMWRTAERAGLRLEQQPDGNWFVRGTNQHLGDVIEGATPEAKAVWESFSPKVKEALTDMTTLMDEARQTVEHHGGDMPLIDVDGAYFPRKVAAIGGQERNAGPIGGRRLGARQGFQQTRTQAEMANATGITYAHPLDAFEAGFDAKLRAAGDAYAKNLLEPLVVPNAKPGFGGLQQVENIGVMNEADATRAKAGLTPHTPGTVEKVMGGINRKLTPIRASYDASGLFQQGMRRWLTDPAGAARDWRVTLRSLKDPDVYHAAMKEYDEAGPGIKYLVRRGVRITAEGEANEVTRLSTKGTTSATGKIGKAAETGQRISSELFDRPLNLHRVAAANAKYKRLVAQGLSGEALDAQMDAAAKAINRMYGWTGSRPSSIESVGLFAPRYFRANLESIVKAASDWGPDAIEGAEARKHLALLVGEGAALVLAINTARGYETEFDPRDSNWMRIRNVGGLDVSPFGSFDILARAIAGTIGGDPDGGIDPDVKRLGRLAYGKASPAMKLVIEPLRGETYMGKPLDPVGNPAGFAWEQFKSSIPFGAQNLIEGFEDQGPKDAITSALVGSLGVSQQPVTPSEKRDFEREKVAQQLFSMGYDDLPGAQKAQVNTDARVSRHQAEADRNTLTRPGDRSRSTAAGTDAARKLDALSTALETGQITGNDWREQYQTIQAELRGAREYLEIDGKQDKDVEGWFDLYDQAELEDGRLNYELLEGLQAEYRAAHPDIDEKVDRIVGARDNATVREYREAAKLAKEYYSIPAYRGMSIEDSRKAQQALNAAGDMVSFGRARNRNDALRQIARIDPDAARLARRAARMDSNPARERFRKDRRNAAFAKFYSDAPQVATA